jgi:hypothetical protein
MIVILSAVICSSPIHRGCIIAFPLLQWLHECTTLLSYMYIPYLVINCLLYVKACRKLYNQGIAVMSGDWNFVMDNVKDRGHIR